MAVFPSFQNHLIMNFAVLMRLRYDVNERRQVVAAFSTGYMGFGQSEVQILSPRFCIENLVMG